MIGFRKGLSNNGECSLKRFEVRLTTKCNYNCSYCNQRYDLANPMYDMSEKERIIVEKNIRPGREWIEGLNGVPYKDDYDMIVFSGGEPSVHPDFFEIVSQVRGYRQVLITTNLAFDVKRLITACRRNNTRVTVQSSFQFEFADFDTFLEKMRLLDKEGMLCKSIPVSIVDLPGRREPAQFKKRFERAGYRPELYIFEGYYKGRFIYASKEGFGSTGKRRNVFCRCVINLVKPNGDIVFCATDSYRKNVKTYGNICDKVYKPIEDERGCSLYGMCHISSASWIEVRSPDKKKVLWRGKTMPEGRLFSLLKRLVRPFVPTGHRLTFKRIFYRRR